MLRTFKSMAKDGREFPLEKCQKTCRSWSSERDFAHRMELDPELSFLSAEETAYLESKRTKESVSGWFFGTSPRSTAANGSRRIRSRRSG